MKILVGEYDFEETIITCFELPQSVVKRFIKLIDVDELLAWGDFHTKVKLSNPIKELKKRLRKETSPAQAGREWDAAHQGRYAASVSWSGTLSEIDALSRERYLQLVEFKNIEIRKNNKKILRLIKEINA